MKSRWIRLYYRPSWRPSLIQCLLREMRNKKRTWLVVTNLKKSKVLLVFNSRKNKLLLTEKTLWSMSTKTWQARLTNNHCRVNQRRTRVRQRASSSMWIWLKRVSVSTMLASQSDKIWVMRTIKDRTQIVPPLQLSSSSRSESVRETKMPKNLHETRQVTAITKSSLR